MTALLSNLLPYRVRTLALIALGLVAIPAGSDDLSAGQSSAAPMSIRVFDVDASPPVGSPLAYDPTKEITSPLSSRGIVILGADKPVVLCAVDWLGIANEAHFEFRERLAMAAETTVDRVSVHTLHQHDAPRCDFSSEAILAEFGHAKKFYDDRFCRDVFVRTANAVKSCLAKAKPITSIGTASAPVQKVASNRRILGDDGKVKYTRFTACRDPEIRAMPVGTIDPQLKLISFRNGKETVGTLSFYATHPQSYYRTGQANPDFPGLARNAFEKQQQHPIIHFNGAGGNIGAGKWNDGSHANRQVLADKVHKGMSAGHSALKFQAVTSDDIKWQSLAVSLPLGKHLVQEQLKPVLQNKDSTAAELRTAAKHLAWLRRTKAGGTVNIGCLTLGTAKILFMPVELFVEYQLAAQQMAPENFVAMAAYGEYGPGYVCTDVAYSQGGYESSDRASRVGPGIEAVLMDTMKSLLQDNTDSQ